jgi:hypothetical protein
MKYTTNEVHYNEINRIDGPMDDEAINDKKLIPTTFHAARPTLHLYQGHQTYELSYHYHARGTGER